MLWPFNHLRKPPAPMRGTIGSIYGMIVAQAREPLFYRAYGVPDTVSGRFDMVLLHLWMVLRMLNPKESLSRGLFDRFCSDMDDNLRELGISDLKVPKKMQEFGGAFYGRARAYDVALKAGPEALAQALDKNIYNGADLDHARVLADYVERCVGALAALDDAALKQGAWRFPAADASETSQ